MKVRIEGTAAELAVKARPLAERLLGGLAVHDPSLSKAHECVECTESPAELTPVMAQLTKAAHDVFLTETNELVTELLQELAAL